MNRASRRRQDKVSQGAGMGSPRGSADVQALLREASALHRSGQFDRAQALYEQALAAEPRHAEALHLLGLLAYQTGRLDRAVELLARATEQDPGQTLYWYNLGIVYQKQDKPDEAMAAYRRALQANPRYVAAQCNLGTVLLERERWAEAAGAFEQALRIKPDYVEAQNNLGVALKEQGRLDEAVAAYRQALALKADHAEAHCNLGTVLMELDRLDESVASFETALSLKPDYVKAHYNLAFVYLRQQRFDRALGCLRTSADLKHNHGRPVPSQVLHKSRIKHEAEQVQYLLDRGVLSSGYESYREALRKVLLRARQEGPGTRLTVGRDEWADIAPSFNRILHYADCPALPAGALNPALDVPEIEARYHASRPEALYVDGLLTDEALRSLRRFCLESTIWKKDYENGYLGAFLGDGFSCPLLLQIAEELRTRFPRIFRHHRLLQSWAFKCDSEMKALNMHADAAAVNVNFWITPDEANRDAESGGLVVWDKEAPKEWNFKDYNSSKNEPAVREFLRSAGAKAIAVHHRQNRALIFNSDLFHESEPIHFNDTYEHRRINVTLLYGRRHA